MKSNIKSKRFTLLFLPLSRLWQLFFLGGWFASQIMAAPLYEFNLDNGLKLLVREDHRAPIVVSQIWYKVGSSYEPNGLTGISHMLEHMMFKGTETIKPGEFSQIVAERGGSENAMTSRDFTAYYQTFPKQELETSFRLEADRMIYLKLSQEEFDKERKVVQEERRLRTDDQPFSAMSEIFHATAFVSSTYRTPVIGWMEDIRQYQLQDLQNWYQQWYTPNNATLVVVGDVVPSEVHQLAQKYFAAIPSRPLPKLVPSLEVPQRGVKRIMVKLPAQLPLLRMGYKAPNFKTAAEPWEPYALEMAAAVLSSSDSARLPKKLVRGSQIAASANAGYSGFDRLPDLFTLSAIPSAGKTIAELEKALREEVRLLQETLVTEEELARIRAQVLASSVYEKDSQFYQALKTGIAEMTGEGWPDNEAWSIRIQNVTTQQIQQVAKKYLIEDGLTIGVLEPQPMTTESKGESQ